MTVKPKWKVFSIRQCFSTEFTTAEAQTLFDALMELDNSLELDKYFKDHNDLVPWHPFEFMADITRAPAPI